MVSMLDSSSSAFFVRSRHKWRSLSSSQDACSSRPRRDAPSTNDCSWSKWYTGGRRASVVEIGGRKRRWLSATHHRHHRTTRVVYAEWMLSAHAASLCCSMTAALIIHSPPPPPSSSSSPPPPPIITTITFCLGLKRNSLSCSMV